MFLQIHMLQSMPPGNLNRDDTGQPKKCIFGGATRGRISSQCLKRNIRHSMQFKEEFGDALADRTTYLPRMVADELRKINPNVSEDDLNKIKAAIASKFKAEKNKQVSGEPNESEGDDDRPQDASTPGAVTDQTGQLVFFPSPFTKEIAELISDLMKNKNNVFKAWVQGKKNEKNKYKNDIKEFENMMIQKSESLTVDIGMFGRMTTSDLVVNVEAACQVAHAISTHEVVIESDYFTAMDDKKSGFAKTQMERAGAAFLGSGETETFFNSAVYYKYLNLDVDALIKHLKWNNAEAARAAGVLIMAAALATPTGKQNSFASHGLPELILVESSEKKRPLSYANAFLKPVEGGTDKNLMRESAIALKDYITDVATAFIPSDMKRMLFAVGPASIEIDARRIGKIDELPEAVKTLMK